jgi:hypothetical protein
VNPYHAAFAATPGFETRLAETVHANYTTIQLSTGGKLADRLQTDDAILQGLEPGQLYHFAGTRILAISFSNRTNPLSNEKHVIFDDDGHGTMTSSLVAQADPDAIIVMAQVQSQVCDTGTCVLDPNVAEGLHWLAQQPWVDVISVSFGTPGAPPDPSTIHPEVQTFLDSSRSAAASGKLVVILAGNYPNPTLTGYTVGPPWVIAAGGYEAANKGEAAPASKGVDVIANFSAEVADPKATDGTLWNAGTSFSAPAVAGTLSRALGLVRAAAYEHHDAWDYRLNASSKIPSHSSLAFRAALNASALDVTASQYDPTQTPENSSWHGRIDSPAVPIISPSQEGWGVVHPGIAGDISSRVLSGKIGVPDTKALNAMFQTQWQAAREAYWG